MLGSDFLDLWAGGALGDDWLVAGVSWADVGASGGHECVYCWGHGEA